MSRWTNNNKNRWRRHRRETSQVLALFLALAMVVSLGVDIGSITTTAYANEPTTEYVEGGAESSNDNDGEGEEPEIPEEAVEVEDEEEPDKDISDDDDDDNEDGEPEDDDTDEDDSDEEESDEVEEPEDNDDAEEPEEGSEEPAEDVIEPEEEILDNTVSNEDYDKDWIERADNALEDIDDEDLAAALVAVVNSQVGYEEQILDDTDKDVYSLYAHELYNGNNDSRDWNTTFTMWALDKAGFDTETELDADSVALPVRGGINEWVRELRSKENATEDTTGLMLYINTVEDGLAVTEGDVVFLDLDQDEDDKIDHVGVVTYVDSEDDGTITEVQAVVGDISQKTLSDYADVDADSDKADAVAVIALPGNDYDAEDDDADAMTAISETIKGYIPISTYIEEAEALDADEDDETEDEDTAIEDEICGYTYTDNKAATSVIRKVVSRLSTTDDAVSLASDDASNTTGVDMSSYITNVNFQKKSGKIWVDATSFTTDDQVKGTISFANVKTETIKANGNKIYIDLPDYIDGSKFPGTYNAYDGGTQSGTYTYQKVGDHYQIVLTLNDTYVNSAGSTIGGNLEFQFEWDEDKIPSSGQDKVEIGDWDGEIKIENKKTPEEEKTENNYNLSKKASDLRYSEDGKTVYIDYTLELKVKKDVTGSITMKDVLTADGFAYGDTVSVIGDGVTVNYSNKQDKSTEIQVWSTSNNTIKAGTYKITYTVKSNVDVSDKSVTISDSVKNEVTLKDEKSTHKKDTTTSTTTGKINKSGKLVSGSDATYIDYTVYLNAGDIVKNLTTPAVFTDTLPDILELQGDVTVKQYDVTGTVVNTTTATVNGQNISYTTPTGQYYYEITYRTKVKGSEVPIGGVTVKNEGKSTGGIDGSDSAETTIPNDVLDKSYVSKTNPVLDSDGKWVIESIKWTSVIDIKGSLEGVVYEDWGELKSTKGGVWFAPLYMTDEQFNAIVVKDSSGNVVDRSEYTLEKSTHSENKWTGSKNEDITNGLFKITFSADVTGPVTIEYETAADMTNFELNQDFALVNWGKVTKDGHSDDDSAQTPSINYQHENRNLVRKYGGAGDSSNTSGSTDITLEPGAKSVPWTISVNEGRTVTTEVTVTDVIADGMTFDESTFKVVVNGWNDITNKTQYCTWSYDASTKTITVHVKYDAFKADASTGIKSYPFTISYSTILPDDFFSGSETTKEFKNTATVVAGDDSSSSTFKERVTRQVVGKNGSYDEVTKTLSYNIIINPDGSTLNKGNSLTVEDTLKLKDSSSDDSNLMQYVHLKGLKLFTALKTTDSSGTVSVRPGTYVRDLTKVDSGKEDYTYTYSEDTDSKGVTSDKFTTYLPDGTAYVIVAEYYVDVEVSEDTAFTNRVKLTGSNSWEKKDENTKVTVKTSGDTYTNKDVIVVTKRDASNYETRLENATFSLERYSNGSWVSVGSITTGSTGTGTYYGDASKNQENVQYGVLYRLGETAAPSGYMIDDGPTYFVIVRESGEATAKDNLPDSISGDNKYSKDGVRVYTVKDNTYKTDGTADKTYYARVEIERYDNKDTTVVNPGELQVTKVWVDSSGNTVTDAAQLTSMPDITVTLTKYAPQVATVVINGSSNSSMTITVAPGTVFTSSWNDKTFAVTSGSATVADDKRTVTINGDAVLSTTAYCNADFLASLSMDTTGASTATVATIVGSATLNQNNRWYYMWSQLDRTEGVTYTITETAVNGYNVSYTINGSDLQPGTTFTPTASGDKVVVTNTANPVYELPSTGGSGTLLTYLLGCLAVMVSMFAGYSTWRSGERRGR